MVQDPSKFVAAAALVSGESGGALVVVAVEEESKLVIICVLGFHQLFLLLSKIFTFWISLLHVLLIFLYIYQQLLSGSLSLVPSIFFLNQLYWLTVSVLHVLAWWGFYGHQFGIILYLYYSFGCLCLDKCLSFEVSNVRRSDNDFY